jgi:hypothetical protein
MWKISGGYRPMKCSCPYHGLQPSSNWAEIITRFPTRVPEGVRPLDQAMVCPTTNGSKIVLIHLHIFTHLFEHRENSTSRPVGFVIYYFVTPMRISEKT